MTDTNRRDFLERLATETGIGLGLDVSPGIGHGAFVEVFRGVQEGCPRCFEKLARRQLQAPC